MPKHLTTLEILQRLSDNSAKESLLNSWPQSRCEIDAKAATGIWMCQFASGMKVRSELKLLCACCGLTDCYQRWNGFMAPKLLRCDLMLTITAPSISIPTYADALIDKLLTHPNGEVVFDAWRKMYKPANIHHLIRPAELMLEALVDKLFPPSTNKVD